MKRYITYFIIAIATVLMATSCEKDVINFHSSKEGGFSLDLKINNTELVTRALTDAQVKELAPTVNIYKPNFEGLIRSYIYGSTGDKKLPEIIYLPAGEGYRVDVLAGEVSKSTPRKANFDTKSYQGSATFDIVAGPNNTTAVAVEAKIVNAITKVSFAESIEENFENGYTLTVALSEADLASEASANRKLVYDASNVANTTNNQSGEGYFIIDDIDEETSIYWNFQGTLTKDGSTFSASGNFAATTDSDNDEVMDLVAARQNMSFRYDVKDGTLKFGISSDTTIPETEDNIIWEPKPTGISTPKPYDIWATHLTLSADVDADQYTGAKVQYRVKNTTSPNAWSDSNIVSATKNEDGTYSATISGLNANTTYEFRLLCTPKAGGEDVVVGATDSNADGDLKEIKTHTAPTIPNAGLENTSTGKDPTTGGNFPLFYGTGEEPWWDSGNAGSGGFGYTICYVATDDYKEGQKSARLESTWAAVKFAAGNLFSGRFGNVIGTSGGTVYFGRPFVGRPTAIRFWVKGAPAQVTDTGKGDHLSKGDYDTNQIKVALGTWTPGNGEGKYGGDDESPILINTTDKDTFVDFNTDAATIAYGDLQITTNGTTNSATINGEAAIDKNWNDWVQVTLPLEYRDLKTLPTHIVISCAASMYGDYFEGSVNSKMWVDAFELIYDENVVTK